MIRTTVGTLAVLLLVSSGAAAKEIKAKKVLSEWPDGSPKVIDIRYVDGTRKQTRYREDGSRKWEYRHDAKGKIHPTVTRWREDGQVFVVERHEHGKKIGIWVYHDKKGRAVSRLHFKDGKQVLHETWNSITDAWQPIVKNKE